MIVSLMATTPQPIRVCLRESAVRLHLGPTGNRGRQRVDEAGDDFFGGQFVGGVEEDGEHVARRDAVGQAPIAADGKQDADGGAGVGVVADLEGAGARFDFDVGLHVAFFVQRNAETWLSVENVVGLVGEKELAGQVFAE